MTITKSKNVGSKHVESKHTSIVMKFCSEKNTTNSHTYQVHLKNFVSASSKDLLRQKCKEQNKSTYMKIKNIQSYNSCSNKICNIRLQARISNIATKIHIEILRDRCKCRMNIFVNIQCKHEKWTSYKNADIKIENVTKMYRKKNMYSIADTKRCYIVTNKQCWQQTNGNFTINIQSKIVKCHI